MFNNTLGVRVLKNESKTPPNEVRAGQALGDTSIAEFRRELHELADWIADYREKIEERPLSTNVQPGGILSQLDRDSPEMGTPFEKIFAEIDRVIVPGVVHWDHPQFMSYFGCTTTNPGILAEMITGALNVNTMTWRTAPAGVELETLVLDWLRQWLTLPNEFTGVVYDTASTSTMHALATAREQVAPNTRKLGLTGRDLPGFRIYASDQAHSSVEKGTIAIGVGEDNVQRVPTDACFWGGADSCASRICGWFLTSGDGAGESSPEPNCALQALGKRRSDR